MDKRTRLASFVISSAAGMGVLLGGASADNVSVHRERGGTAGAGDLLAQRSRDDLVTGAAAQRRNDYARPVDLAPGRVRAGVTKNVLDYMPKDVAAAVSAGTNTADLAPYVQDAVNHCTGHSALSPMTIRFPDNVTIPMQNVVAEAAQAYCNFDFGSAVLKRNGVAGSIFTVFASGSHVIGGVFDGEGMGDANAHGLAVLGDDNEIFGTRSLHNMGNGFYLLGAKHIKGEYLDARNNGGAGIEFTSVLYGQFSHLYAYKNGAEGAAVDIATMHTTITNSVFEANGVRGCFGGLGSGASSNFNTFSGNVSFNNNCAGFGIQGRNTVLANNTTHGNYSGGAYIEHFDKTNHPDPNHQMDLGHDVIIGNTFDEGPGGQDPGSPSARNKAGAYSLFIDPEVPDVAVSGNVTPNAEIHYAPLAALLRSDATATSAQTFYELQGSTTHILKLLPPTFLGKVIGVYNGSTVAWTLGSQVAGPVFKGKVAGTGKATLSIPAGSFYTLTSDGRNWIATGT